MADPLSLATSIVALLEVSKSVVSYLQDVKNAPTELRKLLLEIQHVQGLLEILKETVQDVKTAASWSSTVQLLSRPRSPLQGLQLVLAELETTLKKAVGKRGINRLVAALLWPFTKKETEEISRTIARQQTLLLIALDNDHLLLSAEIKKEISTIGREVSQITQDIRKVDARLGVIQQGSENAGLQDSVNWLSNITYQVTHDEIYRQRLPGSLSWFLALPNFKKWIEKEENTLFCSGIAGAGKSVVAATVIDHLLHEVKQSSNHIGIAWIYCTFRSRQQQTPFQMLASIAAQLARQREDLMKYVVDLKGHSIEPTEMHVLPVLAKCKLTFKSIYVVIDALDEYSEDSQGWLPFVRALNKVDLGASILITARPLPTIEEEFTSALKIEIVAKHADMLAFVQNELQQPRFQKHLSNDVELRSHIEAQVLQRTQGMFLLAKLHMDSLRQKAKYSKTALRKAANELPKELDALYDSTMERVNSQDNDDARLAAQVIAWVYYSVKDLSIPVVQQALARQRDDDPYDGDCMIDADLLLSVCAGLVIENPETKTIRLMHTTVAEYLDRYLKNHFPDAAVEVHHTCIKQMQKSGSFYKLGMIRKFGGNSQWWWYELQEERERLEEDYRLEHSRCPFSEYAEYHVNNLDGPYAIEITMRDKLEYACNLVLWDCCKALDATSDLPLAIFVGDFDRVLRLIQSFQVNDIRDLLSPGLLSRYLAYSLLRGNDKIARLLLNAGADVRQEHTLRNSVIDSYPRAHALSGDLPVLCRSS